MAKIQAVWALDIGQAALKALKLVPGETPDQVVAEAFDFIEYPKILSQPDADPEQLVRESLETFLERNDLKGCKVAIAVPGQAGLVKFIKLPPVEKKRIPDIVKFEARQQIPFALDEVVWAYQQIGDDDEEEGGDEDFTMAEVGLFAMKRDQINRAILPFRNAGIEVDFVQMGPIALYNFITFDKIKGSGSKDSIVLLDIGADNTDLIITDGTRIWQRNVPIGGNHFTRALTKELKLTFAKAEHLKRNATKAPDPRSIFTAMRGVFNDFASEVNRSIGFYSSVNRQAKIAKVIGLGNGFKLPGLQKFLQQNLSHEVEKLEGFARMTGDEVTAQPVFQDNLPSFAVAYGLAVQGLNRSGLRTNLLPPEIEQVRMIRAKKPWALAASALLMLGFSALYLGEYRVLAKVSTPQFKTAVEQAKSASSKGSAFKSDLEKAKGEFLAKESEGKALVGSAADRGQWADFLRTFSLALPDPVRDFKLDPQNPLNVPKLDKLRVHVDAIQPVWRENVAEAWFNAAPPDGPTLVAKSLMHPYDRANAPKGEGGWVVQVVGHHYNPYPSGDQYKIPEKLPSGALNPERTEYGPYAYIVKRIIPSLNDPKLRLYGISHVTLAWMVPDKAWTTEKGAKTNNLTSNSIPILGPPPPPATADATGGGMGGMGDMMKMMGAMGNRGGAGQTGMMGMDMQADMMRRMTGMGGVSGMGGANDLKKKEITLTRTDFLLQFVWFPVKAEEKLKPGSEEEKTKLDEVRKQLVEAQGKGSEVVIKESDIETASLNQSKAIDSELTKALSAATKGQPASATPGPGPGPGPGAGAPALATPPK
jgi:type IV pilus assembly protein PilM